MGIFSKLFSKFKEEEINRDIEIVITIEVDETDISLDSGEYYSDYYKKPTVKKEPPNSDNVDTIKGLMLTILYVDARGNETTRLIKCSKIVEFKNSECLYAECQECGEPRTFRTDRILEITEYRNGQVYDNPAEYLAKMRFWSPPEKAVTKPRLSLLQKEMMAFVAPAVKVLVFFARADGHYHASEKEVISDYIENVAFFDFRDIPTNFNRELFESWYSNLHVDSKEAEIAIEVLHKEYDGFDKLCDYIQQVVEADGVYSYDERLIMGQMLKSIK